MAGGTVAAQGEHVEADFLPQQHPVQMLPDAVERVLADDLAGMPADQAVGRAAVPLDIGVVGETVAVIMAEVGDQRGQRIGDQLQPLVAFVQFGLDTQQPAALLGFMDGPDNGVGQALQARFDHIVARAALECLHGELFGERAGNEDEGNMGGDLAGQGEGGVAIEAWQHVVGQDHIEGEGGQGIEHALVRPGAFGRERDSGAAQLRGDQLCIQCTVFDHQDPDGLGCGGLSHRFYSSRRTMCRGVAAGW
ncbi:hypothetical protein D3C71_1085730 [compost metagenome]